MLARARARYARDPEAYLRGLVITILVGALTIGALFGALAAKTFGLGLGRSLILIGVVVLASFAACLLMGWLLRDDLRAMRSWVDGRASADEDARRTLLALSLRFPARLLPAISLAFVAIVAPAVIVTLELVDRDFDLGDVVLALLGGLFGLLYALAFAYGSAELGLRPLREDLASTIDRQRLGRMVSATLISRLLVGLAVTALVAGFCLGVFIAPGDSSLLDGAEIAAVAVAVALIVGSSLAIPLTRASLAPIENLTDATRAVASGDLETRVPVTSADELGELVIRFNEMVAGLREREALRDLNAELVDELRESRARIVAAADAERQSVERDLHDGAQQHLVLLSLKLQLALRLIDGDPPASKLVLGEARDDLEQALAELRDLAHGIYPSTLASDGLPGALADAAARSVVPVSIDCDRAARHLPELEAAVYFCCMEALQNAAKHGGDGVRAKVSVAEGDGEVRFEIADDGAGFDAEAADGSSGLQNMADRIGALGGELTVDSAPGEGTRVVGSVPVGR